MNPRTVVIATCIVLACGFMVKSALHARSESMLMQQEQQQLESVQCPSSPAMMHAKCVVTFGVKDFGCSDVKEEVQRRMEGKDGWKDLKSHPGTYKLISATGNVIQGSRTTGDGTNYVDMFAMSFSQQPGQAGCIVSGCSVAQSTSYYDYSTNFCNMFNLLCGTDEGCRVARHDIRAIDINSNGMLSCQFQDKTQCKR